MIFFLDYLYTVVDFLHNYELKKSVVTDFSETEIFGVPVRIN